MTDNVTTGQAGSIFDSVKMALGLFNKTNKVQGTGLDQEIRLEDEYKSKISDEEIISLTSAWKVDYEGYFEKIKKTQETNYNYWLGKQKTALQDSIDDRNIVVNKIFEALETFLPIATRSNPEPLVKADNTMEGQQLAKDVKDSLVYTAEKQSLKRKLARMTRNWAIYLVGALEVEYDSEIDDIKTVVIKPTDFIFDKEGHIDEQGLFQGEYLGVENTLSARKLGQMFPDKKKYIFQKVSGKLGTKIKFIKWWYRGRDVFFTMDKIVLGKFVNPHWNYDGEVKENDVITGAEIIRQIEGKNHLERPTAPYVFLSIFSTGKQPHDETSLISQNICQQDQINKRYGQLDKNIDSQNNGIIVDLRKMTKEQAAQAASALRRGQSIGVDGNPNEVIARPNVPALPADVWNSVRSAEQNLSSIFGVSGSTPTGVKSEESVRGKIQVSQMDASRIGGGITEFIEKVAETWFNLVVQMMIVHYDTEHYIQSSGDTQGQELAFLINSRFNKSLNIKVKEGSLVPKDPLTERNEAVDLWSQSAIDPLSLYKKLDFPDPVMATQNLILWQMFQKGQISPEMYLPGFPTPQAPAQPGMPTQRTGGPAVNPMTGTEAPMPPPEAGSQTANALESKQLLQSVPIK